MNQTIDDNNNNNKKRPLYIRILAFIIVVILVCLIITTLIVGITGGPKNLLFALIFSDVIIPIGIYSLMLITRIIKEKKEK